MYGQLLAMALEQEAGDAESEHDLLRELARCRVRLAPRWAGGPAVAAVAAASGLAVQLDYDLALLRLCRMRGIACGPERFGRPEQERHRLERALGAAGLAVVETR